MGTKPLAVIRNRATRLFLMLALSCSTLPLAACGDADSTESESTHSSTLMNEDGEEIQDVKSATLAPVSPGEAPSSSTPSYDEQGKDGTQSANATPAKNAIPGLLGTLARGDISSIPQDPRTYNDVGMIIAAMGYSNCSLQEPELSLYKPHFAEIMQTLETKTKNVGSGPGALNAVFHPQFQKAIAFLDARGCESDEVQAVMENALHFVLGHDPVDRTAAYPLLESESKRGGIAWRGYADNYCFLPPDYPLAKRLGGGRKDPACAKLIEFMNRGRPHTDANGWPAPAVGEIPQIMYCTYAVITDSKTGRGPRKVFKFWYKQVPKDLASYSAHGRNPFPGVIAAACTEFPKDSHEAEELAMTAEKWQAPSPGDG